MAFTFPWALSCLPERVYSFPVSWRHVESLLRPSIALSLQEPSYRTDPPPIPPGTTAPGQPSCRLSMFLFYWACCFPDNAIEHGLFTLHSKSSLPQLAAKLVFNFCPALVNQLHLPTWVVGWKLSWPRRLQTPILTQSSSKFVRNKHLSICYLHFIDLQSLEMV